MAMPVAPATRMSADERRAQIVELAVEEFARTGLHGTSTETIARRAGVSQPYLFRLFGTKKELFLAGARRCFDRTLATFRGAASGDDPAERLHSMGSAYRELLADRTLLLGQMQSYAACADDDIRGEIRRRYAELWQEVERLSGAPPDAVREFFAHGMLMNVAAALDLAGVDSPAPWVRQALYADEDE
jgi:AcrR family transcriptional regulator